MFQRKLRALEYPEWSKFNAKDQGNFRVLVTWLEETKIRHYKLDDRGPLRQRDSPNWNDAFAKYLTDMNCSRPFSASMNDDQRALVLDWLLSEAVSAEYSDHSNQYNQINKLDFMSSKSTPTASTPSVTSSTTNAAPLDCSSNEFKKAVLELAAVFSLPSPPSDLDPAVILRVVRRRLQRKRAESAKEVTAAPAKAAKVMKGGKAQKSPAKEEEKISVQEANELLESYPLGFSTGDKNVDKAATILRLLYINDLRDLQTLINEVIVTVQEYTADPKTDARLGQVGRS